jgi:RNA recognition motif-containing protein
MGKKLYVGNLAFEVTEEELRALFGEAGTVEEATIGQPGPAGRARGFGYVEMATEDDATKAMALLHGREHHGRRLNVKEPQDPDEHRFRRGGGLRRKAS